LVLQSLISTQTALGASGSFYTSMTHNITTRTIRIGFLLFISSLTASAQEIQPINNVIGDISYLSTFQTRPTHETSETLRIQTHLEYVVTQLISVPVSHLSDKQRSNRSLLLDHLGVYADAGIFPANYDFPGERKPCFIDQTGNICAVGYLIEKSAGRQVAENVNELFQYDYIEDMNDKVVVEWMKVNGLTLEECAMIQPTYQHRQLIERITPCEGGMDSITGWPIYVVVFDSRRLTQQAEFVGGDQALYSFIEDEMNYPQIAKDNEISGTVFISMIIDTTGKVCHVKLLRGIEDNLDQEALRLVNLSSGHWSPARFQGKGVYVKYTVPIKYKLSPSEAK